MHLELGSPCLIVNSLFLPELKVLRSELDTLRQEACTIPVQFTLECQCALEEVRKQSELLTLESSNAEGNDHTYCRNNG